MSEDFWTINVNYKMDEGPHAGKCTFKWERGNIFDQEIVRMYYDTVLSRPTATVIDIQGAQRRRAAPVPLCTLELQKKGSQSLRMSGERIMKIAEELYQGGYISYPRTETTIFAEGYDLRGMVQTQAESQAPWSSFAQRLVERDFRWPASGGQDDKAHPPIHPTRPYDGQGQNTAEKARVYEFIARYFLASCAPDALGQETKVFILICEESFKCTGLMVTEKNWLEVFPWANWGGAEALPRFNQNQQFEPEEIKLHSGTTQPPPRMKESDLLSKMDEYGIGTDATVADHIAKQLDRGYATKDNATLTFAPTPLGEALISAYRKMGLENLWLPNLRGTIERNIDAVAKGHRPKQQVLQEAIDAFKGDFDAAESRSNILVQEVRQIVFGPENYRRNLQNPTVQGDAFAPCTCGANLILVQASGDNGPSIECADSHGGESSRKRLPKRATRRVSVSQRTCSLCGPHVRMLDFVFDPNLLPPTYRQFSQCTCCVKCDLHFAAFLRTICVARSRNNNARNQENHNNRGRPARGRQNQRGNTRARQRGRVRSRH